MTSKTKKAKVDVERFNRECPVGTLGFLHKDGGIVIPTSVQEPAFVSDAGMSVAFFDNVSGYYLIDRFKRME